MKRQLPPGFSYPADAVVIGASAGGIDALFVLFEGLPPGFRLPILVVLHLPDDHDSRLAGVFSRRLGLVAQEARPGAPAEPGMLHFAPPGYHLLVEADHRFSLSCDPPVLYSRPSVDVLMEACADAWGARLAGMVLTGANPDGAAGLARIRQAGGLTAVQDPADAQHPVMPEAAIRAAGPDFVLPLTGLRSLLRTLACP